MKTNSRIFMALMLALLATSCKNKDDHMLTVINEDGTCSREYTFKTTQQWLAASADEDYDSIIDKSSVNHVYINGRIIPPEKEIPLPDNAEIRLADEIFLFKVER